MKRYRIFILLYALTLCFTIACSPDKKLPAEMVSAIDSVRTKWVPDRRINIFNVDTVFRDGRWQITAETTVPDAKQALEAIVNRYLAPEERQVQINLLPAPDLGDSIHALVCVSVANLRRSPQHSAELVDQVVCGMVLKVLKRKSYWYLIQTPSGYAGWITGGSFSRIDGNDLSKWTAARKVMVGANYAQVLSDPNEGSTVLSDAVLGSVYKWEEDHGLWTRIMLPDGREGYIRSTVLQTFRSPDDTARPDGKAIVKRAKSLLGIPYLWGGHSSKGFDCSGFTGTVFRIEGRQLPRDANMQAQLGQLIEPDSTYGNIIPGDLIFFGPDDRITHVGISLGGPDFIHCSDDVHINSLDDSDPLFNAYRKRTFRFFKRL